MASAIHQHESAIDIHISPPSWTSLSPPTPSHPSRLSQRNKSLFIWQDRSASGSNKVSHVNLWAGSSLSSCKVRGMSGHLRRKKSSCKNAWNRRWTVGSFHRRLMGSRSFFKCNTVHAILFLLCLLNSRSFCFLSPEQVWRLCFCCCYYSHINSYVPFFFPPLNCRVSANLWLIVMPSVIFWITYFYYFSFFVSFFCLTTVFLMTLLGLSRGFDSITHSSWNRACSWVTC